MTRLLSIMLVMLPFQVSAKLSCDDLSIVNGLLETYSNRIFLSQVRAGSGFDEELLELSDLLENIAQYENTWHLKKLSENLSQHWINENWPEFEVTLLTLAEALQNIDQQECLPAYPSQYDYVY